MEMASLAYPDVFTSVSSQTVTGAAVWVLEIYRRVKGLHRIPGEKRKGQVGAVGYRYFYNPSITMAKTSPRRMTPRKPKVKNIGQAARESVAVAMAQVKVERPVQYQMVKRLDGSFAGVVKDGVLHESFESFVDVLNAN